MIHAKKVSVQDTVVWSQRRAVREYSVEHAVADTLIYTSTNWQLTSTGSYNSAINIPIARRMNQLDHVIYNKFLLSLEQGRIGEFEMK